MCAADVQPDTNRHTTRHFASHAMLSALILQDTTERVRRAQTGPSQVQSVFCAFPAAWVVQELEETALRVHQGRSLQLIGNVA